MFKFRLQVTEKYKMKGCCSIQFIINLIKVMNKIMMSLYLEG